MRLFIVLSLLGMLGCATPGGQAELSCQLGKLPQTLQALAAAIEATALNPSSVVSDIAALGEGVAPDQFSCAVQAIAAALAAKPVGARQLTAIQQTQSQHAVAVLQGWLASHGK